ncbi:MAG: hypothetical protein Q8Q77_00040, partial [Phenylobacterium sp.]|nr:hypothetical protein [Phenylobacterium sp.]
MLNLLRRAAPGLVTESVDAAWRPPEDAVWIDLVSPSREEELAVEAAFGVDLPTREETAHLEPSSRLYQEDGSTFLTATLLSHSEDQHPVPTPVTFVLVRGVLGGSDDLGFPDWRCSDSTLLFGGCVGRRGSSGRSVGADRAVRAGRS